MGTQHGQKHRRSHSSLRAGVQSWKEPAGTGWCVSGQQIAISSKFTLWHLAAIADRAALSISPFVSTRWSFLSRGHLRNTERGRGLPAVWVATLWGQHVGMRPLGIAPALGPGTGSPSATLHLWHNLESPSHDPFNTDTIHQASCC